MTAPGYRNPEAQVARVFSSVVKKIEGAESLKALREEIRFDAYQLTPELCEQFEAETHAFELAVSELGLAITKASDTRRLQAEVLRIVKETTGLKPGVDCSLRGQTTFRLERAELLLPERHSPQECRLLLTGPRLRADGAPYVRGSHHHISYASIDDLREALGMSPLRAPAYAAKDPGDLTADELRAELEAALEEDCYFVRDRDCGACRSATSSTCWTQRRIRTRTPCGTTRMAH